MLTLTESQGKRNAGEKKRANNNKGKKKVKQDKSQKKTLLIDNNVIVENNLEVKDQIGIEEELQIHELMPVTYKTDDHEVTLNAAEVTFEQATVTEQDCQGVTTLSCIDGVPNGNKYVIITLLDPEAQGLTSEDLLSAEDITGDNDKDKQLHKLHKKVILLHKIDPETATTIPLPAIEAVTETATVVDEAPPIGTIKNEFDDTFMTIDFSDFSSATEESINDQKDLTHWIKKFNTLTLQHTESGKPYVKCPACTAIFFKAMSFEKHVSYHLRKQNDRYVCVFCKYESDDPSNIFDHLNIHQDQCEICNVNLTRKNFFKKHWELSELSTTFSAKRDRWGRFICTYCKLGFDLLHQLQKHWFKHSCSSKKTSQCNYCSGLFDTDEALQNHVCLKCPVCGKICDSVHRLRSHTRYEKHYLYCQICSYEFILAVDHEKHMQLHKQIYQPHKDYAHCLESEDRTSFQCEVCGKIYHTMSMLVLHIHDDHKISTDTNTDEELARISIPDFERACEEVLDGQT